MGWLQRLFGQKQPQNPQQAVSGTPAPEATDPDTGDTGDAIPPERVGLNGEYDQSGLAKRVALAFDQDPELTDVDSLYVAQTGSVVVLKGQAPSQDVLNKMIAVALDVNGASNVDSDQVTVS
jgi:hypothetical protein